MNYNSIQEFAMKRFSLFLAATVALLPSLGLAAQNAQANMYCLSLRMQKATDRNGSYSMQFTTLAFGANGELAPEFFINNPYTNSSFLIFTDELSNDDYDGAIALDLPAGTDDDNNGLPDFFEVDRSVNATTSGIYQVPDYPASGSRLAPNGSVTPVTQSASVF
jgi:hypothetical protein